MSGGYIKPQKTGEHQLVVFTFAGELKSADVKQWNEAVLALKKTFGPNIMGVTIKGDPTPANLLRKKK
jgi:hypothetical protein